MDTRKKGHKNFKSTANLKTCDNPFQQYNDQREIVKYLREKDEKTKQNKTKQTNRIDQMYNRSKFKNKFGLIHKMEMDCIRLASLRESIFELDKQRQQTRSGPSWKSMRQPFKHVFSKRKENFRDFSVKKRQIFLHKMNIQNKNHESQRLTEFIQCEQELLQTEVKDFKADCDTVFEWTQSLLGQIRQIKQQRLQQGALKVQKQLRLSELEQKIYKTKGQINQKQTKLEDMEKYKQFVEKILKLQVGDFLDSNTPTKIKRKEVLFLTETKTTSAKDEQYKSREQQLESLLKMPEVVQRIFDFSEQKCIESININQVLFEEIRNLKDDFKRQKEYNLRIIKDLIHKEQDEKQKLNEARKISKIRNQELNIQHNHIQNHGEIDLMKMNDMIYEICSTFQNTRVFKYQGVPKEQQEFIEQNMRILETCVLQKINQFKRIQDTNLPTHSPEDLKEYNRILKNVIQTKRFLLNFPIFYIDRTIAFKEQRIKDEQQQRVNQQKKQKKKAARYGRPANAKTFWEPKKKVVVQVLEDDEELHNRKYMRDTLTIFEQEKEKQPSQKQAN